MTLVLRFSSGFEVLLCLLILFTTGCAGSIYGWTVRTTSTPPSPSLEAAVRPKSGTVAVLTPLSVASLRGNEAGMGQYLGDAIKKISPHWTVIEEHQVISLINEHGLTGDYTQMLSNLELTHVLDRDILRKIGAALGSRYVFQPRLAYFSQQMLERWEFPFVNFKVSWIRSATMRLSLQFWDSETGKLLWSSTAESNFQSEAINLDPVFIEDIARVTFGSMLADFLNKKTSSKYTPLNQILNLLIRDPVQDEYKNSQSGTTADQGDTEEPEM